MNLARNEIGLWLQPRPATFEQNAPEEIFDTEELKRYQRISNLVKKEEFASSRLLLKKILHHYLPEQAASICTLVDDLGRPFWYFQQKKVPLYFSLSHTKKMIVCAVGHAQEIGCDIEYIRPRKYEKELVVKVLSKKEMHHYSELSDEDLARHFFYRCWTLKEAYLKAKGVGLRNPLVDLDFQHTTDESGFVNACERGQKIKGWQFLHQFFSSEFSLAIAANIQSSKELIIRKHFSQ